MEKETLKIPAHIAFIMDGNGRWAAAKKLPREAGHKEGARSVEAITKAARELGVKYITLYAFSTENWKRSPSEINALMKLLEDTLDKYGQGEASDVRLLFSGRRAKLSKSVLLKLDKVLALTAGNKGITVNLALNYGARQEITDAVNHLIASGKTTVQEEDITANLYVNIPPPDLIVRTSGENRLSNFMLWQAAYSELYFTDILWPDFKEPQLLEAVKDYSRRERRYGGRKD